MCYKNMSPSKASITEDEANRARKYLGAYRYLHNAEIGELMKMTPDGIRRACANPLPGGTLFEGLRSASESADFLSSEGGYDAKAIESFMRSISILIADEASEAGYDPSKLTFLTKKGPQSIFVETRYPGMDCFNAIFNPDTADSLLRHNDLFQSYQLSFDFDSMEASTEYRQMGEKDA